MKKIIFSFAIVFISFFVFAEGTPDAMDSAITKSKQTAQNAITSIPIPQINYFQERRTIEKWARYWDKPNIPTFVYIFVFDKCIGYYVADGKPSSTRSYLTPEYRQGILQ